MKIETPHIVADSKDFAQTVLMPGDPLRSQYIAQNFLTEAKLVNNVRGIQSYTGLYRGTRVSVMASGMGMPSMGIYSHELFTRFEVQNILRIGSAGSIHPQIHVRDLVLGQGACTDSNWAAQFHMPGTFAPIASFEMLCTCVEACKQVGANWHVGNLLSSDSFYGDHEAVPEGLDSPYAWSKMGVMAIEMEAAALYMNAARYGKRALAICTISDHVLTGESLSAADRQNSFTQMMEVALETACALER